MRVAAVLLALLLAFAAPAAGQTRASLPDIEDEVMCLQCGTPLNLSTSAVADRERAFIRRRIAQGQTKEQIKAALVAEFGPAVLALPEERGFSLAAYVVPVAAVLLALAGVVLAARRWRRARGAGPAAETAADDPEPLAEADARRLDAELAAFDR